MILIGKRALVVLWIAVMTVTGFLGVYGYHAIDHGGADAPFAAQQFLYVALLLFVFEAVLFIRILLRSRNIERELDKLIEITRFRGLSSAQNLNRLGPIGEQIGRLYDQLNALSERKSLKISALSELTEFLMNNISVPAVACTIDGRVVYVSRVFTERMKKQRSELLDTWLEDLAPGVTTAEVFSELDLAHSAIQRKSDRHTLTFYPIRNAANQLAYILCVFQGNAGLIEQTRRVAAEEASGRRSLGGGIQRILEIGRTTAKRISRDRRRPDREE